MHAYPIMMTLKFLTNNEENAGWLMLLGEHVVLLIGSSRSDQGKGPGLLP